MKIVHQIQLTRFHIIIINKTIMKSTQIFIIIKSLTCQINVIETFLSQNN